MRFQLVAPKLIAICVTTLLAIPPAAFADGKIGPAVSGVNAKISIEGGLYDDKDSVIALGSLSAPLGHHFGVQLDGALGELDNDALSGGGAHLFTRDPSNYLLGVYGSYHQWNSINIWRVAVEYEFYLDRFSITGLAGSENIDIPSFDSGLQTLTKDDNHFFGHIDLDFYPLDDLKIYGGYRYISEVSLGAVGVEYLLRNSGFPVSLFAKARFGDDDHTRITGGLRVFLGADRDKSLIIRHRTEDPQNYTPIFPEIDLGAIPPLELEPEPEPL